MSLEVSATTMGPLERKCKKTATPMPITKRNHYESKTDQLSTSRMAESRAIVHAIWTLAATFQVSRKSFLQQIYLSLMQYNSFGRPTPPFRIGTQLADVVAPRGTDFKDAYSKAIDPRPSITTSSSQQRQILVLIRSAPTSTKSLNLAETFCYPPSGIQLSDKSVPTLNATNSIPHTSDVHNDDSAFLGAPSLPKKQPNDKAKAELFKVLHATPSPSKLQKKKLTLLKARKSRNLQTIPENQEWKMSYSSPICASNYFILEESQPKSIFENDSDSKDDDDEEL